MPLKQHTICFVYDVTLCHCVQFALLPGVVSGCRTFNLWGCDDLFVYLPTFLSLCESNLTTVCYGSQTSFDLKRLVPRVPWLVPISIYVYTYTVPFWALNSARDIFPVMNEWISVAFYVHNWKHRRHCITDSVVF